MENNKNSKPLTINDLCDFTEQILLPAMKENFATKDDLENFATKDDLENFATKDDLKEALQNFATKDYIDKLITKEDQILKLTEDIKAELAASTGARIRQQDEIDSINNACQNNKKIISEHGITIKKIELKLSAV